MARAGADSGGRQAGRIIRHRWPDRLYHWVMAAAVLVLVGTAFLPIVGVKFPWVTIHWSAGLVLTVAVLYHIVRALFWLNLRSMAVGPRDVSDTWRALRRTVRRDAPPPPKPGKYPLAQRLYHHAIAVVLLTVIVTGLLMMVRVDTPFWTRNPYWLSQTSWMWIYVLHGFSALATLSLIIVHIYFGVRPEKLWVTRSMIRGWITRPEYLAHHDPTRWEVDAEGHTTRTATAGWGGGSAPEARRTP